MINFLYIVYIIGLPIAVIALLVKFISLKDEFTLAKNRIKHIDEWINRHSSVKPTEYLDWKLMLEKDILMIQSQIAMHDNKLDALASVTLKNECNGDLTKVLDKIKKKK